MWRKIICLAMVACMACSSFAGCQSSTGVSQEEYDAIKTQRDALQSRLEDMTGQRNELQDQLDDLKNQVTSDAPEVSSPEDVDVLQQPESSDGQILLEQDGIKITYTGLGKDYMSTTIKLRIENQSDQPITVQERDMSINGIMVDGLLSCDVSPGKIANTSIDVFDSNLEENGISNIENVELSFNVFNADTWDDIIESDAITIQV